MIIDCDSCAMAHTAACTDCVVDAFVGHDGILELAEAERQAIDTLSDAGLVSPIRLVVWDSRAASGE